MYCPSRILFPGSKQGKSPINECSKIVRLGNKAKNRFIFKFHVMYFRRFMIFGDAIY